MGTGFRTALDYNCFIGVDRIINFGQQFFIREPLNLRYSHQQFSLHMVPLELQLK
jgi:hypothetical protein